MLVTPDLSRLAIQVKSWNPKPEDSELRTGCKND